MNLGSCAPEPPADTVRIQAAGPAASAQPRLQIPAGKGIKGQKNSSPRSQPRPSTPCCPPPARFQAPTKHEAPGQAGAAAPVIASEVGSEGQGASPKWVKERKMLTAKQSKRFSLPSWKEKARVDPGHEGRALTWLWRPCRSGLGAAARTQLLPGMLCPSPPALAPFLLGSEPHLGAPGARPGRVLTAGCVGTTRLEKK